MGRKKYETVFDALKDIKMGETKDVRLRDSIVTIRKGAQMQEPTLLKGMANLPRKAKVITK